MDDVCICEKCVFELFLSSDHPCCVCHNGSMISLKTGVAPPVNRAAVKMILDAGAPVCSDDVPTMKEGIDGRAPKIKTGKLPTRLLPMDILHEFVVPAYQEGVIKYVRESWRKGFQIMDLVESLDRHLQCFMYGEDYDTEAKEKFGIDKHHMAAVVFCACAIMHTMKYHPELDDRFDLATGEAKVQAKDA